MGMDTGGGDWGRLALGMGLGAALGMGQRSAGMPAQQAPSPAPQPSVAPSAQDTLAAMQQQAAATPSTFLTGPQGVDPKTVKTTKQSLYGN